MSPDQGKTPDRWQAALAPERGLPREGDGHLKLPLRLVCPGSVARASLVLTVVEAEQLHAALCYALDGAPVPDGAPPCRDRARYRGGRDRY
ncbi:hypothetical protein ABZU86_03765 [Streptomyces sp. NPDC005271]|uniref:hypothetical protein n=1 Tax=unclassified Streptomyces TaxID=2593676 RepID=UPI0033B6DD04